MDSFKVPKKVNRHVLSALQYLSSDKPFGAQIKDCEIIDRVRYQMRRLKPVPHLSRVIMKSLRNMEKLCIVSHKSENHYTFNCNRITTLKRASPRVANLSNRDDIRPAQQKKINRNLKKGRDKKAVGNEKKRVYHRKETKPLSEEIFSHSLDLSSNTSTVDLADYFSSHLLRDSISNYEIDYNDSNASVAFAEKVDDMHTSVGIAKEHLKRKRKQTTAKTGRKHKKKMKKETIIPCQDIALATSDELAKIPDGIKRLASPRAIKSTPTSSNENAINDVKYDMSVLDEMEVSIKQSVGEKKIPSRIFSLEYVETEAEGTENLASECVTSLILQSSSMIVHAPDETAFETTVNAEPTTQINVQALSLDGNGEENKEQGDTDAFSEEG